MFSGIIERVGTVRAIKGSSTRGKLKLEIAAGTLTRGLKAGASVSVGGACLTVTMARGGTLSFDVVRETLRRSTLGGLKTGARVNLERALRWKGRIEGHFVLGHVDARGTVRRVVKRGEQRDLWIAFPSTFRAWLVPKGSVAVDGVSLTLGRIVRSGFWVHLVPHTLRATTLGALTSGDRVNLEGDILAKLAGQRRPKH